MRSIVSFLAIVLILYVELCESHPLFAAGESPAQGKAWAVVIGINDYQKAPRLHYAIQDAKSVGNLLEQQGFTVIRLISPKDTNRQKIESVLGTQLPKKLGRNDRVLVFFSGHGKDVQYGEGQRMGYLLPAEADPEDLASTAISMGRVREWANFWPAKHVLFIVDSCYSGIIGEHTKSLPPMTALYLQQISREKGRHLIAAGGADQEALEVGEWGQSLLTHFLLEGLRDKAADLNSDGIIPTSELYQFLDSRVFKEAQFRGHMQRPEHWSLSPGHKGEFVFPGQGQQTKPVKLPTSSLPVIPSLTEPDEAPTSSFSAVPSPTEPDEAPTPSLSAFPSPLGSVKLPIASTPVVPSPTMIRISAGSFRMGGSGKYDGTPIHNVQFTKPFAIARYETTFDEYDRFARATGRQLPSDAGWGRGSRPVINVSWHDAKAYAQWLSQQTGKWYRLPTEAEWEYAARSGGMDQEWAGTSEESQLKNYAVYDEYNYSWDGRTELVGSKKPNGLGFFDMSGNVMEWVEDCWHMDYTGAPAGGLAWLEANGGNCHKRVTRGGSWDYRPVGLRLSARNGSNAGIQNKFLGFRLAQDLEH